MIQKRKNKGYGSNYRCFGNWFYGRCRCGCCNSNETHCPAQGVLRNVKKITDIVEKDETIAVVETES